VRNEFLLHFRNILSEIFKVLSLINIYPQNRGGMEANGLSPFELLDVCKCPHIHYTKRNVPPPPGPYKQCATLP
jgi:hypothetical protein